MSRTRPLSQWLRIQEQKQEDAEDQFRTGARKLEDAEQQLNTLENFRHNHNLSQGEVSNGFMLNSIQQFHDQVDKMIDLQSQQVAIQQSQQRHKDQKLRDNNIEVRKTELLIERYQQEEQREDDRREQRQQDEMAEIMLRRLQE